MRVRWASWLDRFVWVVAIMLLIPIVVAWLDYCWRALNQIP